MTLNKLFFSLSILLLFSITLFTPRTVSGHVLTPQQVVADKYVVQLVISPQTASSTLHLAFSDKRSGKRFNIPLSYKIKIYDAQKKQFIFISQILETSTGSDKFLYTFTPGNVYEIFVEFEKSDEPGKIYKTKDWLWAEPTRQQINLAMVGGVVIAAFFIVGTLLWSKLK